jgi:AcrR family transcriptional regulator
MRTIADNLEADDVHTRIVVAAYGLFSRRGIRDVGVEELIRASGVAKATFYRHFPSKDDLVLAFLKRRDELWMMGSVVPEVRSRAQNPEDQLLAIFDVYDQWFQDEDFEACSFVKVLLEMGRPILWARRASNTWPGSASRFGSWPMRPAWRTRRRSPSPGTSS